MMTFVVDGYWWRQLSITSSPLLVASFGSNTAPNDKGGSSAVKC